MNTEALLPAALDLLLKSALILTLAGLVATVLRRRSAAARHAVWCAAFAVLLLLPLTKAVTPRWTWRPAREVVKTSVPESLPTSPVPQVAVAQLVGGPGISPGRGRLLEAPAVLLGVWAFGTAVLVIRQAIGLGLLRRARRRSVLVAEPRLTACCGRLADAFGLRRLDLRMLQGARVPATWGVSRNVLMLPPDAVGWDEPRLEAVLRHELAHIARRDFLTRTAAQFARALYWPNPLAWLAVRALRREQEHACDDLVLNAGTPPETYAALLLEAARLLRGGALLPAAAVAMARPTTLEGRVLAIVDQTRDRRPAGRLTRPLAGAAIALTAALCGAAQLLAVDPPAPPAKANATPTALDRAAGIIIPRLEFSDATLRESINFLRQKSAVLDPEHKGVNFVLNAPAGEAARITLSLTNIPVSEAARYVAKLGGLSITADRDAIVIEPGTLTMAGSGTLVLSGVHTYTGGTTITSGTLDIQTTPEVDSAAYKKAQELIIPKLDFREATLREAIDFIRQKGASLDPEGKGVNLVLNPPPGDQPKITISLQNVPLSEAVRYITKLAGLALIADGEALIIGPAGAAAPVVADSKAVAASAAAQKAKALILPKLEFRDATVREAVDFFMSKARTLDPDKAGVNIVIAPGVSADTKITLSLTNASIYDALTYVAKLAKLKLAAEANALVLQP